MKNLEKFGIVAAAIVSFAATNSAQATTYIAYQANNGAIVQQTDNNPSDGGASSFINSFGGIWDITTSGSTPGAPTLLDSTNNTASASGAGVLDIYVTSDNKTVPSNVLGYRSSFTSNAVPSGWTIQLRNYVNTANAKFSTGSLVGDTLVGDVTFTSIGTLSSVQFAAPINITGPYSVTTRYTLTSSGMGSNLSTVTLAAVPEPGTWALMIMGFGGAGAMLRSRRRSNALTA
jgi:hypothetical protein